MPAPVLRRVGSVAGDGVRKRPEQLAAPVPAGASFAIHCCARALGLNTAQLVRDALYSYLTARAADLTAAGEHADVAIAALGSQFGAHLRQPEAFR
jgi:hypothetical protein